MVYKLDKKDKRILYELDKDARQPLTKIAKKVNLSRESILYRIKKYKDDGMIRDFLTVIDMAKLGFTHHKIYLKLHNTTENLEEEFIDFLVKNPNISWVSSCDGKYSLIFGIKSKSLIELNELLMNVEKKYWNFIKEKDISSIIDARHFYRDYLIGEKGTTERKIIWGGEPNKTKLDDVNVIILDELSKNSRVNAVEIASKLKISSDTVIKRIKSLEASQIITHYMIWPNVNKLIGNYFKVLITLHNVNKERESQLTNYVLQNPNIVYLVNSLGPWQLELDIEVENTEEMRKVIREILNKFSDIISDYTLLNIYEEYKFKFFEKEALQS